MAMSHGAMRAAGAARLPPGLVEPPAVPSAGTNLYLASLLQSAQTQQVINYQASVIQNLQAQLNQRDAMTHARPQPKRKGTKPWATKKHALREGGMSDVERDDESFARGVSGGSALDGFDGGGSFARGVTEPPPGLNGFDALDSGGFTRGISGGSALDGFDGGGFARGVTGGSTTDGFDGGGFERGVTGGSTTTEGFTRQVTGASTTDGCVTDGEEGSKRRARAGRKYPRPTKTQRELYRTFVDEVEKRLRVDPAAFDVDGLHIPEELTHNDTAHEMLIVKAKYRLRRLQAELLGQPPQPRLAPPGAEL